MSILQQVIDGGNIPPIYFGISLGRAHIRTLISMAIGVARESDRNSEKSEGAALQEDSIGLIIRAAIADTGGEKAAEKWPDDVKDKVVRAINGFQPGLMYEVFGMQDGPVDVEDITRRQWLRNEFYGDTIMAFYKAAPESFEMFKKLLSDEPELFNETYEKMFKNIDYIQGLYDENKMPAEHYNAFMEEVASFVSFIKQLNELYFLPHGDYKYPDFLRTIIVGICMSVEKSLEQKGFFNA